MAQHSIEPEAGTVHGYFSRELAPCLTIDSGDTVRFRTLMAGWSAFENPDPYREAPRFMERDEKKDTGHALCGPVAIRGAEPGMTLEIRLKTIRTGSWGWSRGGGSAQDLNKRLGVADNEPCVLRWALDPDSQTATDQGGRTLAIRPFMGVLGMPPDEPGEHPTWPPRACGGNLDCKELVAGSRLFLPIPVHGALFSIGDGHAVQGDGEVSGVALECPIAIVEAEFVLHEELRIAAPRAHTAEGWLTFGLDEDMNEAWVKALEGMLELMHELHGLDRKEALALASLVVDLRITQVVNGTRGVHAVLPHGALDR